MNVPARFALGLLLPALSGAFEPPRMGFDDYTTPEFDAKTFYLSYRAVLSYERDSIFGSDSALRSGLIRAGYEQDTVAKTFWIQDEVEHTVHTDAADRLESLDSRSLLDREINDKHATFEWTAQGKVSLVVTRNIHDSSLVDSAAYTWRHSQCADLSSTGNFVERIRWTADDQGRCLVGVRESMSEGSQDWNSYTTEHWTWGPDGPTRMIEMFDDLDTVRIHRITYENGLPVRDSIFYPGSDVNSTEACENSYVQQTFRERRCHSEGGSFTFQSVLGFQKSNEVGSRDPRYRIPVEARLQPGRIHFTNHGTETVRLQVVRISGARLETVVLEPGRSVTVPLAKGSIVWRATSATGSRSGVLNAVR